MIIAESRSLGLSVSRWVSKSLAEAVESWIWNLEWLDR